MTPYERLMNHTKVDSTIKQAVRLKHETLNPLLLKEKLDMLKKKIFDFQKKNMPI